MLPKLVETIAKSIYCILNRVTSNEIIEILKVLPNEFTGSIFFHCDPTASHYLILMDTIFDVKNFVNEIIWKRQASYKDTKQARNT